MNTKILARNRSNTIGKPFGNPSTPHSNTGSSRQAQPDTGIRAHLDYLVIVGVGDVVELTRAIWAVFGTNFDWDGAKGGVRGKHYSVILRSAQTIEVAFTPIEELPNHGSFRLSIPGSPLQHVQQRELAKLLRYCHRCKYRCTRLDWAIDDFDHLLDMDELSKECECGNYSGALSHRYFQRKKRGQYEVGRTIYLGSSQSDKQIRIYDKNVESKGQINSIRFEVQWRNERAQAAFAKLVSSGGTESGYQTISMLAVGSVAFYQRRNAVLSRSEPLEIWQDFVSKVGGFLKMSVQRIQPMISDKIRWIESQVIGTLALISQIKGFDDTLNWLERRMHEKLEKMPSSGVMYVKSWFDRIAVEKGRFEDWTVLQEWDGV